MNPLSSGREQEKVSQLASHDGIVVLDFETSGMSPVQGDRAIEIGAVRIVGGAIVDRFQSLMNPGRRISGFIEAYTGISNAMVQAAPPAAEVMAAFDDFIGEDPLVAHNASFDRRFLDAELQRIDRCRRQAFACSLLVARRLYPEAPNHKLSTLVAYKGLPTDGRFHCALADAEMTAHLWLCMGQDLRDAYGFEQVPFALMSALATQKKHRVEAFLRERAMRSRR
jgi:DNA polymerase-3 subunit epsilon